VSRAAGTIVLAALMATGALVAQDKTRYATYRSGDEKRVTVGGASGRWI
jgi:hypothetical protein